MTLGDVPRRAGQPDSLEAVFLRRQKKAGTVPAYLGARAAARQKRPLTPNVIVVPLMIVLCI